MEVKEMKRVFYCLMLSLFLSGCAMGQGERDVPFSETSSASPEASSQPKEVPAPEATPTTAPEPKLLGRAQTELLDQTDSRMHNIGLAIDSLNGFVLDQGVQHSCFR